MEYHQNLHARYKRPYKHAMKEEAFPTTSLELRIIMFSIIINIFHIVISYKTYV